MSVFASGRQMQPRSRLIFGRSVPAGTSSVGLRSEAQSDQTIARERNATERKAHDRDPLVAKAGTVSCLYPKLQGYKQRWVW